LTKFINSQSRKCKLFFQNSYELKYIFKKYVKNKLDLFFSGKDFRGDKAIIFISENFMENL